MSSKRKAAPLPPGAVEEMEGPAAKRRKIPLAGEETAEGTTKTGLGFLNHLKNARDKSGWLIATHFRALPDRKKLPDYYRTIGLPMALDIIEGKLEGREYPTMTSLEGDFRRMISNAKSYNEKQSRVYSDAEKVRKALSNFMIENNPAYKSGDYQPFTTPVPEGWQDRLKELKTSDQDAGGDIVPEEESKPTSRRTRLVTHVGSSSAAAANNSRASSTPAIQDAEGAYESFEGNNFQQAQEKIVTEMINFKDEDNFVFIPFTNLPPRTLVDYYKVIKHPVCLRSVQKAVRGIKGRDKPTGTTFLKSWQAFEEEVSYIWNNARDYNEDSSDLFILAGELESYFRRRLAEAKRVVAEPPQPKVKLRMPVKSPDPPKITLKFGGQKVNGSTPMTVDNEALKRQQDHVRAGANGHASTAGNTTSRSFNPYGSLQSGSGSAPIPALGRQSDERSGSTEHTMNGLKTEVIHGQSPALSAIQPNGSSEARQSPSVANLQMPPPMNLASRVPSGSPHSQTLTNGVGSTSHSAATPYNSRLRQQGKDASDALISNLNISTHPGLKISKHLSLDVPASATRTQQSVTIAVPSTHFFVRIQPTVSSSLMHRPSKTIVSCGNARLQTVPQAQSEEHDPRRPIYESRVVPGVNAIEVEVIAGPPRGAPKVGTGQDIEYEKITVFVHLQKS